MKVYQTLAHLLRGAGADVVFGVMGDGNMHWVAEYMALPGARWCPAWHEAGAVGMADGYASAASHGEDGAVGVATVTMGPGVAQALGALTAAVRTRSRLLVVTAEPAHVSPPNGQDIDQRSWARTAGAAYRLVTKPADLSSAVAETMASASAGRPAVLAIAASVMILQDPGRPDVRAADVIRPGPSGAPVAADLPDSAALRSAVRLLAAAQRPLVLLGRGAVRGGAVHSAADLGRQLGACFLTTVPAKGCLASEQEPFDLGLAGTMAHPAARSLASAADVVLVVGAALDTHNTSGGSFFGDAEMVRIDCRPPDELWRPGPRMTEITAESASAIAALAARLPAGRRAGQRTAQTATLLAAEPARRAALAAGELSGGLNPWAVIAAIDDAAAPDAHIVTGVGHFWYFAVPYLSGSAGRTFQFGYGFGMIGQGLPLATGAAVALSQQERPTILIEGDGSFLMNPQELQSAIRFGADLLVIVLNNAAYGSEFLKLGLAGLNPAGGAFDHPVDIVGLARALGADARRAQTMAELRAGLADLGGSRGVRVLDIAIPRSPMSEAYERMHLAAPVGQSAADSTLEQGAFR